MADTLSNGYKRPNTGERGFWQILEDNITQLNSHDHDGTDSEKISPKNLLKSTATLASGSWVSQGGGTYKQTVTVPTGYTVDTMQVKFYVGSGTQTGYEVMPTIRKVTATTFDVFTNDNSVDYVAIYG